MRWREPLGIGRLVSMTESRYRAVKAYENLEWINSRDARPLRILAEYLEPESRFEEMEIEDTIVVFGSARLLPRDVAEERLREVASQVVTLATAQPAVAIAPAAPLQLPQLQPFSCCLRVRVRVRHSSSPAPPR